MPKQVQQVIVLISCPSELAAERNAAKQVVDEVNRQLGSNSAVELKALTAEDDVVSGIGSDAQDVINGQFPAYDIYVGMMGTKFGTATPRAGSGTEEEYILACQRRQNGDEVDIMFFFSSAPVRPDDLDLTQVAQVREFKKTISSAGVYYKEFPSLDEFRTMLRQGLHVYAKEWEQRLLGGTRPTVPQDDRTAVLRELDDDADAGPLDFLAEMEDAVDEGARVLDRINDGSQKLTSALEKRNEELGALTSVAGTPSYKRIRRVIDQSAADLVGYAGVLESNLPSFRTTMGVLTDRSARLVSAMLSQDDASLEELQQARTPFAGLADAIASAYSGLWSLRQATAGTPSPTSSLRKAVRRAIGAMDDFLIELEQQKSTIDQMLASLTGAIEGN